MTKFDTKTICISAVLIALSVMWIYFFGTIDLGIWSFTPFSHLFIYIGIFISPITGILTAIGSFMGFVLKGAAPVVLMRAGSHIIFVIAAIIMIRKMNLRKTSQMIIFLVVTGLLHALAETACVYIALFSGMSLKNSSDLYIWGATCGATFVHNTLDCLSAYAIGLILIKANLVEMRPLLLHKVAATTTESTSAAAQEDTTQNN